MAKAMVELVGALSCDTGGRRFEKGKPQLLTVAAEIAGFKSSPDFRVTMMEDAPAKPPKKAAPEAPPPDDDDAEETVVYTKGQLGQKRKAALVEIGIGMGLAFSGEETAKQMVEDILLAQEGDEE
jgi:hypothetical protein